MCLLREELSGSFQHVYDVPLYIEGSKEGQAEAVQLEEGQDATASLSGFIPKARLAVH